MVEKLDELITAKAGFHHKFSITGQTYSRQQDVQLIFALAAIGAAVKKICTDIRVLQAMGELYSKTFEKNIFEGLTVQTENVARIVREELPFLGLEKAMMWLTEEGVDRQKVNVSSISVVLFAVFNGRLSYGAAAFTLVA
ncbi:hypothetical protein COOONC_18005 [Cooperia oncophora]